MEEDARNTARALAALAGLPLDAERVEAVALALPFVQAAAAALAGLEYGDVEPAGRFRIPRGPEP